MLLTSGNKPELEKPKRNPKVIKIIVFFFFWAKFMFSNSKASKKGPRSSFNPHVGKLLEEAVKK